MINQKRSITLLELILAVILMSMLVMGFASINMVSRKSIISLERRSKVQNAVAYILAHMSKNIGTAIGDKNNTPVLRADMGADTALQIRVDTDSNGKLNTTTDKQIAYSYNTTAHEVRFYSNYTDPSIYEVLSDKITSNLNSTYVTYNNTSNNYLEVNMQGRWDPGANAAPENPQINMTTSINMPSVSVN